MRYYVPYHHLEVLWCTYFNMGMTFPAVLFTSEVFLGVVYLPSFYVLTCSYAYVGLFAPPVSYLLGYLYTCLVMFSQPVLRYHFIMRTPYLHVCFIVQVVASFHHGSPDSYSSSSGALEPCQCRWGTWDCPSCLQGDRQPSLEVQRCPSHDYTHPPSPRCDL